MWYSLKLYIVLVSLGFPNWVYPLKIKNYFDLDLRLMTQLKSYSEDLQSQISVLSRYIEDRRAKLAEVGNDRERYLSNPLNSFSLLHHLHFDWKSWRSLMEQPMAEEQIEEIQGMLTLTPKRDEFMDSLKAAKDFHDKQTDNFDKNNKKFQFSPLESLEIAQFAYDQENYEQAEDWLSRTLKGYKEMNPQQKELYDVLSPVSENQVQDLYEKVLEIRKGVV
uniref:Uncharacterized protein LOC108045786 n=1 Tax=Drosophila rhopaloa TaxID=1041015 RepID=A0A6P4F5R7_DRORH